MNKWFHFNSVGFIPHGTIGAMIDVKAPTIRRLRLALAGKMVDTGIVEFAGGSVDRVIVKFKGGVPITDGILKRDVLPFKQFVAEVKASRYYRELVMVRR